MRVALHTRAKPGKVEDYEGAHREVPDDLTAAIRAGGATQWTIWRSGTTCSLHSVWIEGCASP